MIFFAGTINGKLVKLVITERTESFLDVSEPEQAEQAEQAESEADE